MFADGWAPRYQGMQASDLVFIDRLPRGPTGQAELWQWMPKNGEHVEEFEVRAVDCVAPEGESSLLSRLGLPHLRLVECRAAWQLPQGTVLLFLEHHPRGNLSACLQKRIGKGISEGLVLRWIGHVISALVHLHSNGLVHGGVCAENVLLTGLEARLEAVLGETCRDHGTELPSPASDMFGVGQLLRKAIATSILQGGDPTLDRRYLGELEELAEMLTAEDPSERPTAAELSQHPLLAQHALAPPRSRLPAIGPGSCSRVQAPQKQGVVGKSFVLGGPSCLNSLSRVVRAFRDDHHRPGEAFGTKSPAQNGSEAKLQLSTKSRSTTPQSTAAIVMPTPSYRWHLTPYLLSSLLRPIFTDLAVGAQVRGVAAESTSLSSAQLLASLVRLTNSLGLPHSSEDELAKLVKEHAGYEPGCKATQLTFEEFVRFCEACLRVLSARACAEEPAADGRAESLNISSRHRFHSAYTMLEKLSQSKNGAIYRCMSRSDSTVEHLCKVLPRSLLCDKALSSAEREVETLRHLNHPHIVRIHDVFKDAECMYLLTEVCKGGELLQGFCDKAGGVTEKMVCAAIRQTLDALAHCHRRGIVHGDLNLHSMFLAEPLEADGTSRLPHILIADCGFVELLGSLRRTKIARAAPRVAPECWDGSLRSASDIFACGVMAFTLLTGLAPWGHPASKREAMNKLLNVDPDFSKIRSPAARRCIELMLRKDPRSRPDAQRMLAHEWFRIALPASGFGPELGTEALRAETALLRQLHHRYHIVRVVRRICAMHLPREQVRQLTSEFAARDRDGDDMISVVELCESLKLAVGARWQLSDTLTGTLSLARAMFSGQAEPVFGDITWSDFATGCVTLADEHVDDLMWYYFREFDPDCTGFVFVGGRPSVLEFLALGSVAARGDLHRDTARALREDFSKVEKSLGTMIEEMEEDTQQADGKVGFGHFHRYIRRQLGIDVTFNTEGDEQRLNRMSVLESIDSRLSVIS
eukprot:gnl/TRDRNA2_/TRDRNA2_173463_c0_seq1.p1 gnl/TRDRNA2_/TRDRNA2_173463_c0~~gnl/TRDRNA2_/TRDRNA2_173463_c0_seq1.p1  ORF type:complete len:1062 (-),score=169.66 gnl/TRDRNA2_/TRDRNA2_173463_c0_seq1:115-3060(-)